MGQRVSISSRSRVFDSANARSMQMRAQAMGPQPSLQIRLNNVIANGLFHSQNLHTKTIKPTKILGNLPWEIMENHEN